MSNEKISITAEFMAYFRLKENKNYEIFISKKTNNIIRNVLKLISERKLEKIFKNRLNISNEFQNKIENEINQNSNLIILELGGGYNLKGLKFAQKYKNITYIDSDFQKLIKNKIKILNQNNIIIPQNYNFLNIDVLKDNILENIHRLKLKNNKILIIAEGLTSYFNEKDYQKLLNNIKTLENRFEITFFSHETKKNKQSLTYKILRNIVKIITKNKSYIKFKSKYELLKYLEQNNFKKIKIYEKFQTLFYSFKF